MFEWSSQRSFMLVIVLFYFVSSSAASQPESISQGDDSLIQLTDMFKLQQLGNASYSPDGQHILFTVTRVQEQDDRTQPYTYQTRLWLIRADGSAPARVLTSDRENASQPAWHPAGRHIAFTRSLDGRSQIMLLSLDGGEPHAITQHERGASSPVWSPDGQRLMFSSSVTMQSLLEDADFADGPAWSTEQDGRTLASRNHADATPDPDGTLAEIRAWLDRNEADRNPRVITRLNFQGETDLQPNLSFSHRYVVDVDVTRPETEPAEPIALTSGYVSWGGGSWSRDGRYVYLHTSADGETHPDRLFKSRLYRVATDGNSGPELFLDVENYSTLNPVVSPDGRWIAFSTSDITDLSYAQTQVQIMRIDGTDFRPLSLPLDRSMGSVTWSGDSQSVYFTGNSNGGTVLYRANVGGNQGFIQQLSRYDEGIRSFDLHGDRIAFVLTTIDNPFELYLGQLAPRRNLSPGEGVRNAVRMTNINARWLEGKLLSRPQRDVVRVDDVDIEYWIMEPTVREAGKTYPLMLQIHGGPSAMWGPGEASMWFEFQYFAARGYGIVYSNPRGSGGYGRDFQFGNYRDWGFGPKRDVLAATDRALELDWVDPERLVVTGGSYAGYLTAFIIGHDHRFKAAFAQRGVYDLHTFLGEGNAWRLVPNHFGGFPWESAEIDSVLRANSPMTYVDQIRTPLLIKHGDVDLRTGVIQSEMLYKALKIREQPVEYVRYPRAAHDMSRTGEPLQRLDRILRIYEYFERYVGE
jgi:dipeptidyl aminopeptidase/acylaminoacyl peptidase